MKYFCVNKTPASFCEAVCMVGAEGLEPPTPSV